WVAQGYVHNRWMLGMALENELYAVVKSLSSFHLFFEFTITPHRFCQFVSWGCMSGATLYLLKKFPGKTALTFCTLTPLWLTLTAGYIEYYPLIAALLPCLLAYSLYSEKMTTNTYWLIGLASAILAAAYIGFIPIAAIVLVYFLLRQPANFIVLFLGALVSFSIITRLFYESPAHYLSSLPASMNLGDTNSVVQYRGLAASDSSIFFKISYALSWQHTKELLRMYFVAGGLVHLSALLYILIANFKSLPKLLIARHNALLTAITAWLWFYFIFMIPKLGPVQDVDLFFATYIVTAFFLGHCIDALPHINKKRIYALIAGNAALSFYLLSVVGIDKISA
ncbi:MAG TPA: hypothetical protein VLC91_01250, partial [Spongiibacteraceae bacterium]|nr:hypothetical protein [Spongiibacteraceae bacterium]